MLELNSQTKKYVKRHFAEKEIKLRREITTYRNYYEAIHNTCEGLVLENKQLQKENVDIRAKYEKLLEMSHMTDEKIISVIKSSESLNGLMAMAGAIKKYL